MAAAPYPPSANKDVLVKLRGDLIANATKVRCVHAWFCKSCISIVMFLKAKEIASATKDACIVF